MHNNLSKPLLAVTVILLAIPVTSLAQSLLYEAFNGIGNVVNAGLWNKVDTENKISLSNGQLGFNGGKASPTWADPALYSTQAFSRVGGRAFISTIRPGTLADTGLVAHFAANGFSTTPLTTGYGIALRDVAAAEPLLRFSAVTPGRTIDYVNPSFSGYDPKTAAGIDYTVATVLRPDNGSFHLVSGGQFGTYPQATLIWVNDEGTNSSLYAGFTNNNSVSWVDSALIADLGGNFASAYGLASAADGFSRTGSLNGSALDRKGSQTWTVATGAYTTDGSIATSGVASLATVTATNQGIVEADLSSPAAGAFNAGLVFRYQDSSNYWYFYAHNDKYSIGYFLGGVDTLVDQSGLNSMANNTTTRLTIVMHGDTICPYSDGELVLADCYTSAVLNTASGAGIVNGAFNVSFDNFAVWPRYVNLPNALALRPGTVPAADVNTLASDSFTDASSTNLASHTMTTGSGWTIPAGGWQINASNQAVPMTESTLAITESTETDVVVAANITFPQAGAGNSEWLAGLVTRYVNTSTYSWLRVKWQNGEPLLELWDIKDGVANSVAMSAPGLINSTNITDLLSLNSTKLLTLAAKGNQLAAYLDGSLILQGSTVNLTGTKVGILNGTSISTPYVIFDNFIVRSALGDTIAPSAVVDLTATNASAKDAPVLSWSAVADDTGAVSFYRVYRTTLSGNLGSQINSDDSTTGTSYTDSTLTTPGTYYYTVRAVDISGNESTIADNKQVTVAFDNSPPVGTISINTGEVTANSAAVTLTLTASDNVSPTANMQMMLSNNIGFDDGIWENFSPTKQWELVSGLGERTVYYKLRDQALNESSTYSDSIEVIVAVSSSNTSSFASDTITSTTTSPSSENLYLVEVQLQLPNGSPAPSVPLTLVYRNQTVITDENGLAQFENLPRGTYEVKGIRDNFSVDFTFDIPNNDTNNGTYRPILKLGSDNSGQIWVIAGAALIIFGVFGSVLYLATTRLRMRKARLHVGQHRTSSTLKQK